MEDSVFEEPQLTTVKQTEAASVGCSTRKTVPVREEVTVDFLFESYALTKTNN